MKILLFSVLLFLAWAKTEGTNRTDGAHIASDEEVKVQHANATGINPQHDAGTNDTEDAKMIQDAGTNNATGVHLVSDYAGANDTEDAKMIQDEGTVNATGDHLVSDYAGANDTEDAKMIQDAGTVNATGDHLVSDNAGANDTEGDFLSDAAGGPAGCWILKNGRLFKFVKSSVSWAKAQKHCQLLGGNLATIESKEEEDFLKILAEGKPTWMGFSDAQQEGCWFWINSRQVTYTNWCAREPNNVGGSQKCALINFTGNKCWDDENCSKTRPFLCEKKVFMS